MSDATVLEPEPPVAVSDEAPIAIQPPAVPAPTIPPEVMEKVLIGGDLAELSPAQRRDYYLAVCRSLGLNPMTKPFEYLTLNGKPRLYALRDCTDQLRRLHGISIYIVNRTRLDSVYIVTARARDRSGREDESTGVVPIINLKGDALANALMKCETKAKRRVTLSIAGLGWLDETELDTIPQTAMGHPSEPVATIHDANRLDTLDQPVPLTPAPGPAAASTPPPPSASDPAAAPAGDAKDAVVRSIFARLEGLYPGDAKADPTVGEDRRNVIRAVFNVEVGSGKDGIAPLTSLPRSILQEGLIKLDRMARQAPDDDGPDRPPPAQAAPPDAVATAELITSLRTRAARVGITAERFAAWLDGQALPRVDGVLQLTAAEQARLSLAFNRAVDAYTAEQAATAKRPRPRKAATGD